MKLIRDLSNVPASAKGAVLALGNFDGLHLGHRAILQETLQRAKKAGRPAAVMTFEPHPREFFRPDAPKLRLMRLREKIEGLRAMGFSTLFMPHFNAALAATSAADFVSRWLSGTLAVQEIITGDDFCFGKGRSGNRAFLTESAGRYGFLYHAIAPVCSDAGVISSTAVRTLLAEGNVAAASALLGRPYSVCGHVIHGDKRGRQLGFPTANIPLARLFVPRAGVYAVAAGAHKGVANIGLRPTFGGTKPQAEIHLFDFSGDLYGQYLRVELQAFLRDEQRFESLEQLKQHIAQDCERAKAL
ncbi:MAG: bifunctional riboflavin kinase/FAD synthetase [Alphaproteobacteria bacterium]|nr:bifunctional riboflavin kinase/FAD synthetase [Alphaproteobacteria bacterium]